ncbi:hypothetical protein OHA10_31225 [Kribbella sp. NBC_00662]
MPAGGARLLPSDHRAARRRAALGYSPATIERHAVDSAAAYARYVARDT